MLSYCSLFLIIIGYYVTFAVGGYDDSRPFAIAFHLPVQTELSSIFVNCDVSGVSLIASQAYCIPADTKSMNGTSDSKFCVERLEQALQEKCTSMITTSNQIREGCHELLGYDHALCKTAQKLAHINVVPDDFIKGNLNIPDLNVPASAEDDTNYVDVKEGRYPFVLYADADAVSTIVTLCMTTVFTTGLENTNACLERVKTFVLEEYVFESGPLHRGHLRQEYYQIPHVRENLLPRYQNAADTGCYVHSMTLPCLTMHHGLINKSYSSLSTHLRPYVGTVPIRMLETGVFADQTSSIPSLWKRYLPNISTLHLVMALNAKQENEIEGVAKKYDNGDDITIFYEGKEYSTEFWNAVLSDGGGTYIENALTRNT